MPFGQYTSLVKMRSEIQRADYIYIPTAIVNRLPLVAMDFLAHDLATGNMDLEMLN